jgi:hypothetical protein
VEVWWTGMGANGLKRPWGRRRGGISMRGFAGLGLVVVLGSVDGGAAGIDGCFGDGWEVGWGSPCSIATSRESCGSCELLVLLFAVADTVMPLPL